jgi:hypothetical protein
LNTEIVTPVSKAWLVAASGKAFPLEFHGIEGCSHRGPHFGVPRLLLYCAIRPRRRRNVKSAEEAVQPV